MKNYYEILEVDRHASLKVIKGVYKLHIKENHPDLFQGEEKLRAEEKLKELNEAYEVLSDEIKRKDYDKELAAEYESELTLLKEENESLKSALMQEEQTVRSFRENNFSKYQENNVNNEEYEMEEYEPDENVTYENNNKYMTKLARKELLLKLVITICIVIAAAIGLYRSTGFNLFDVFWKALTAVFK